MIRNESKSVVTTHQYDIWLDAADILNLLRIEGHTIPHNDVTVEFSVPGGGDWSNTDIAISAQNPVHVRWVITEHGE